MSVTISTVQLWVHDQAQAVAFWTDRVGFEIRADVTVPEMGNFRWVTVGPSGQPDVDVVLMAIPGPPVMDDQTAGEVRALTAKGFTGTVFLTTDDCRKTYEELRTRGVEFVEEPTEMPYGLDAAFRDPSGNNIRVTQRYEMTAWG